MVFEQVVAHGLWRSLVSALDWGSRGREFKSPQPDVVSAGHGPELAIANASRESVASDLLAGVSLFLAAIGLYGVVSYSVAQRAKEIGLRVALGARKVDVLRVVATQAAALLAFGLVIGLAGGLALGRIVSSLLFGVSPADLAIFAAAIGSMTLITIGAVGVPARRALGVDPAVVLRGD